MTQRLVIIFWLFLSVAFIQKADGQSLILEWNASVSPDAAGYDVYYGTNSGDYAYKIDAGNATSVAVTNLSPGVTYYFAATAYDASGTQSPFSPEISFLVPGAFYMTGSGGPGAPVTLQFSVAPGHSYEVQATTDFQNWLSVWESDVMVSNVWMQFTDPDAATFAVRFYRLVTH